MARPRRAPGRLGHGELREGPTMAAWAVPFVRWQICNLALFIFSYHEIVHAVGGGLTGGIQLSAMSGNTKLYGLL
jgi:hypothetical protein